MFENVKEFSERYTIFYKFQSTGKIYKELKREYLTFPQEHEKKIFLKVAFPSSLNLS